MPGAGGSAGGSAGSQAMPPPPFMPPPPSFLPFGRKYVTVCLSVGHEGIYIHFIVKIFTSMI